MGLPEAVKLAYSDQIRTRISDLGALAEIELTASNWQQYPQITRDVDIIFSTWGMPWMDAAFLSAFPRLRVVFYAAGAVKFFVTDESYERGIIVCSAAAANAIPVAEYTISAILMSLKNFWNFSRETRRDRTWTRSLDSVFGAYHSVVGLISLGAVARSVVEKLSQFDLDIIAYDPFVPPSIAQKLGVKLVSLEDLFRLSDVVSLHSPWIPETENLINERLLRLMKHRATFINTSRGAIINEQDLCRVLKDRADLTAILDVTWPEPPSKDSPLYELENIIFTPHIAGSLGNEISRMGDWMIDEAERYLNKIPLRHQVTRAMLARMA